MSKIQILSDVNQRAMACPQRRLRWLTVALLTASSALALAGCSRSTPANAPALGAGASEQVLVQRSAEAFQRLRQNPRFSRMDGYLQHARAVMIFPRLVKASLVLGGEGGNGVVVARRADGAWSAPAFCSLGSPSLGLQIGYQQATVVLFIMDQPTLENALRSSLALGGKAGATLGYVEQRGATAGGVTSPNIYQVVDADGVFAGVSLDGYVIGARSRHNLAYYGKSLSTRDILFNDSVQKSEAGVLERALAPFNSPAG
jgi:lipid-binding SYLF domain-containing protein